MPDLFDYSPAASYPYVPGFKESDTSRLAAESMAGTAPLLRERCYRALRDSPGTADEIADRLGLSVLAVRPRFSELRKEQRIADTHERRPNASGRMAKVWTTTRRDPE